MPLVSHTDTHETLGKGYARSSKVPWEEVEQVRTPPRFTRSRSETRVSMCPSKVDLPAPAGPMRTRLAGATSRLCCCSWAVVVVGDSVTTRRGASPGNPRRNERKEWGRA